MRLVARYYTQLFFATQNWWISPSDYSFSRSTPTCYFLNIFCGVCVCGVLRIFSPALGILRMRATYFLCTYPWPIQLSLKQSPTLKTLQMWLQGHPHYNVDPSWGQLVLEWVSAQLALIMARETTLVLKDYSKGDHLGP